MKSPKNERQMDITKALGSHCLIVLIDTTSRIFTNVLFAVSVHLGTVASTLCRKSAFHFWDLKSKNLQVIPKVPCLKRTCLKCQHQIKLRTTAFILSDMCCQLAQSLHCKQFWLNYNWIRSLWSKRFTSYMLTTKIASTIRCHWSQYLSKTVN